MSSQERSRALRQRLYSKFGHGGIKRAADAVARSRVHVSYVLNGHVVNEETLTRLESWLAEVEQEQTAEPEAEAA